MKENLEVPEFVIVKQDINVSKFNGMTPLINAFQGLYAPLIYYCRLRDKGYDSWMAHDIAEKYKEECYNPVLQELMEAIK